MNRRESREQAFLFLFEKTFKDETIDEIMDAAGMARDIEISEFAERIFNGINENHDKIEEIIEENIKGSWKKERLSRVSLSLLRLSIYEMLCEKNIPYGVSINEAVELAKKYSTKEDASFINGVLGTVSKKLGEEDA